MLVTGISRPDGNGIIVGTDIGYTANFGRNYMFLADDRNHEIGTNYHLLADRYKYFAELQRWLPFMEGVNYEKVAKLSDDEIMDFSQSMLTVEKNIIDVNAMISVKTYYNGEFHTNQPIGLSIRVDSLYNTIYKCIGTNRQMITTTNMWANEYLLFRAFINKWNESMLRRLFVEKHLVEYFYNDFMLVNMVLNPKLTKSAS
jgi:hypothetical protein